MLLACAGFTTPICQLLLLLSAAAAVGCSARIRLELSPAQPDQPNSEFQARRTWGAACFKRTHQHASTRHHMICTPPPASPQAPYRSTDTQQRAKHCLACQLNHGVITPILRFFVTRPSAHPGCHHHPQPRPQLHQLPSTPAARVSKGWGTKNGARLDTPQTPNPWQPLLHHLNDVSRHPSFLQTPCKHPTP